MSDSEPALDLSEIVGLYKEDARRMIQEMRSSLGRWEEVQALGPALDQLRKLSHQLRGSGRTYGFFDVTRIGKAMEHIVDKIQKRRLSGDERVKTSIGRKIARLETIFKP